MKEEYSAGGVVYKKEGNKGYILFILDPYGVWALPKGHIEDGESSEEAALREVSEETALDPEGLSLKQYLDSMEFNFHFEGKDIHKKVDFYLIEADPSLTIKPQKEEKIEQVKWVEQDKAVDFAGYKNVKDMIEKALNSIE